MSPHALFLAALAVPLALLFLTALPNDDVPRERVPPKRLICAYLVGLGVAGACFPLFGSIEGREDFEKRFALAVGVTSALAAPIAKAGRPVPYVPVALVGFLGIVTLPLAFLLVLTIHCASVDGECLS